MSFSNKRSRVSCFDNYLLVALKLVADSKFLDSKDLGRFLLLTSKRLSMEMFDNRQGVWKCLCANEWNWDNTVEVARFSGMTAEKTFRKLLAPTLEGPESRPFSLRPLKYRPEDYLFVVQLFHQPNDNQTYFPGAAADTPFFHKAIPGKYPLSSFFNSGCSSALVFEKPIWKEQIPKEARTGRTHFNFLAKVQIMRIPDEMIIRKLCSVSCTDTFITSKVDASGTCPLLGSHGIHRDRGHKIGSAYGKRLIAEHVPGCAGFDFHVALGYRPGTTAEEGDSFEVFALQIFANVKFGGNTQPYRQYQQTMEEKIPFAHFLEELLAWDDS